MPQKASTTWSGGSIKLDTADKKQLIAHPQQQHNLSLAPNRNVLLTAPPNRGMQIPRLGARRRHGKC